MPAPAIAPIPAPSTVQSLWLWFAQPEVITDSDSSATRHRIGLLRTINPPPEKLANAAREQKNCTDSSVIRADTFLAILRHPEQASVRGFINERRSVADRSVP